MSYWILLQIIVNIALFTGIAVVWLRMRRPPKEDPRLSRGLQLLQSKIAVLEDLSDRTDLQVKQLTQLLENKGRQLQGKILDAEKLVHKVENSMHKSMEVAEIFQDKIPHKEIIERQNTIKYVQAARMAHQGRAIDEIAAAVDLPREQLEFIVKVNRDQLMFNEEALPEWARTKLAELDENLENVDFSMASQTMIDQLTHIEERPVDLTPQFEPPQAEYDSLKRLNKEFRSAVEQFEREQTKLDEPLPVEEAASQLISKAKTMTEKILTSAGEFLNEKMQSATRTGPRQDLEIEGLDFETPVANHRATTLANLRTAAANANLAGVTTVKPLNASAAAEVRPVRFPKIELPTNKG